MALFFAPQNAKLQKSALLCTYVLMALLLVVVICIFTRVVVGTHFGVLDEELKDLPRALQDLSVAHVTSQSIDKGDFFEIPLSEPPKTDGGVFYEPTENGLVRRVLGRARSLLSRQAAKNAERVARRRVLKNSEGVLENWELLYAKPTDANLQALGLSPGDLLFYIQPWRFTERVWSVPRVPHIVIYYGEHEGTPRCVHMSMHGLRLTRVKSLWNKGGDLYVRKLLAPQNVKNDLIRICQAAVRTQTLDNQPDVIFKPGWIMRGVQKLLNLEDAAWFGQTCVSATLALLAEANILALNPKGFWTPHDVLFEPSGVRGALSWSPLCGLDVPKALFNDFSRQSYVLEDAFLTSSA